MKFIQVLNQKTLPLPLGEGRGEGTRYGRLHDHERHILHFL